MSRIGWYDVTTHQEGPMEEFVHKMVDTTKLPGRLGGELGGMR
jgi:hypothetical protein